MKVAVVGSRNINITDLKNFLPAETKEIISGGAVGVDTSTAEYATKNNMPLTVFLPEYEKYGRSAPLKRNIQIIDYADIVLAFWDGKSRGTKFVIDNCKKRNKKIRVFLYDEVP